MRQLITFLLLTILVSPNYSQNISELEKSLDSLNSLKLSHEKVISDIEKECDRIQSLINRKLFEQAIGEIYYCKGSTTIKKTLGGFEPIGRLNYGSKVKILDQEEDHYQINFNGTVGWVIQAALCTEEEFERLVSAKKANAKLKQDEALRVQKEKEDEALRLQEKKENERKALLAAEEKRKADLIKKYGSVIAQKIIDHIIWLGMTDTMAQESIGKPIEINRSVGSWGVHEQWVYRNNVYLYFENGILSSWQD